MGVADRDAGLTDTPQPLLDQEPIAVMERLIAVDEQRAFRCCGSKVGCRRARIFSAQCHGVPSAVTLTSQASGATNMRLVSAKRPSLMRSTQDHEIGAERRARLRRRADEVGDDGAAGLNQAVAHPAHAPRVSMRSSSPKPRSRLMLARTSSALKMTALSKGAAL